MFLRAPNTPIRIQYTAMSIPISISSVYGRGNHTHNRTQYYNLTTMQFLFHFIEYRTIWNNNTPPSNNPVQDSIAPIVTVSFTF